MDSLSFVSVERVVEKVRPPTFRVTQSFSLPYIRLEEKERERKGGREEGRKGGKEVKEEHED
jgi:hypothetical protein